MARGSEADHRLGARGERLELLGQLAYAFLPRAEVGVGIYVIPVVCFPHLGKNPEIVAACRRRNVRLFRGIDGDLAQRLADLSEPQEIRHRLDERFTAEGITIL